MKKILKGILTLTLLSALYNGAYSQITDKAIVQAIDSFAYLHPAEKVSVHTDRNSYIAGENIWFKTYVTLDNQLTTLSGVVYIELADANGNLLKKQMHKLVNGTASGSIDIKSDVAPGNYFINAYTLWMLNFPEFVFRQPITIYNTQAAGTRKAGGQRPEEMQLRFFPEGGELISGLPSRVAFKATTAGGMPVSVSGAVTDGEGKEVAKYTARHDGMGFFTLTPEAGKTYKATISGSTKTITLPPVKLEGVTMEVDNNAAGRIYVNVGRSATNKARYNKLNVVAQLNSVVVYMGKLNGDEGQDAFSISKKDMPPGVLQITVMDEAGKPLAERLAFVANHALYSDRFEETAVNTGRRAKSSVTLNLGVLKSPNTSVSIINAEMETAGNFHNIYSDLLLAADLRGTLYNPGFYFRNKDTTTLQLLDLVMMTNGWRRFSWDNVLAHRYDKLSYPFERNLSIAGTVSKSAGKQGKINLIIKGDDSTSIMSEAAVNPAGVFVVDDLNFRSSAKVYYQGQNADKQNAIVGVNFFPAYVDTMKKSRYFFNDAVLAAEAPIAATAKQLLQDKEALDAARGTTLKEVVVTARKRSATDSLNQLYASDIFYNSDQTLAIDSNTYYYDIWQYLERNVAGISIVKTDTGPMVNFSRYAGIDFFSENTSSSGVAFFLNEVPTDISYIDGINPNDVAMVKIFKGAAGIALGAYRGAIALYTRKGVSKNDWRQKGFDMVTRTGFTPVREFAAVDYSVLNPQSSFSDKRPTLFWAPELKVDASGKARITWYNDDLAKSFRVVVQGIDADGRLVYAEKEFK